MKLRELKKLLEGLDDDLEVILSEDEEGQGFSPLAEVTHDIGYLPRSSYAGTLMFQELTEELREQGYDESDVHPKAKPCVVLWPTA